MLAEQREGVRHEDRPRREQPQQVEVVVPVADAVGEPHGRDACLEVREAERGADMAAGYQRMGRGAVSATRACAQDHASGTDDPTAEALAPAPSLAGRSACARSIAGYVVLVLTARPSAAANADLVSPPSSSRPRRLSYTGHQGRDGDLHAASSTASSGAMDTGLDFVGARQQGGGAAGPVVVPRRGDPRRGSAGRTAFVWAFGELVASSWWARRRGADLVHSPATLGPMWTSMPTVITIHDMLYWSHPELMATPLYTRPGEVDGEAGRSPTRPTSSPTARSRRTRSCSTSASRASACTSSRSRPRPRGRAAPDRCPRRTSSLASGQRRAAQELGRADPCASRSSRRTSVRGW